MKKVLITGGAGFIGSHLADALVARGCRVIIIDNLLNGSRRNINLKAKFFKADIGSSVIESIFKKVKPDIVFHFAARVDVVESIKNPQKDVLTNIVGGLNVLENCKKYNVKKVIFASSCAVYGQAREFPTPESAVLNPGSPYAIAKYTIENYLKVSGLPFTALRFSNVYGSRQKNGVIAKFSHKKTPVIYGDGKQTRDFLYVDDAVLSALAAMESKATGIFNIGTGKETRISELFDIMARKMGKSASKKYLKPDYAMTARSCLNHVKAKEELGWSPQYSLEQGIENMKLVL